MNKNNTTTTKNELNDADLAAVSGGVIARPDGSTCTDPLRPIFSPMPDRRIGIFF
jgi:bacteriocin-like protein